MAVAKLKKVHIIAHQRVKNDVVKSLYDGGLLHIEIAEMTEDMPSSNSSSTPFEDEEFLSKVLFVLDFLSSYTKRKGFFEEMIRQKIQVRKSKFDQIESLINFEDFYAQSWKLKEDLREIEHRKVLLAHSLESLEHWVSLKMLLKDIKPTVHTCLFKGEIPSDDFGFFEREMGEEIPESFLHKVSEDSQGVRILTLAHKTSLELLHSLLHKYNFREVYFPEEDGSPKEVYSNLRQEYLEVEKKEKVFVKKAQELALRIKEIIILKEYLENKKIQYEVENNFARSEKALMIKGWVPASETQVFRRRIEEVSDEIEIVYSDPLPKDNPPVLLENKRWVKPFEMLTRLYGWPNYYELDPTPYLAPFFLVAFAFSIGDVGYGLFLSFFSWFLRSRLKIGEGGKQLLTLIIYCGLASVVAGVITGGWFAQSTENLPPLLKSLMLFEPLKEPLVFLLFTIALGFFQVWFGVFLEMYDNFRKGNFLEGLYDQGSVLIFLPGAALLVAGLFMRMQGGPTFWWNSLAWVMFLGGTATIILFHNRKSKNVFGRVFGGIYSLYGMTSFVGDTISYARIMALGLATFLIGWAVNLLSGMLFEVPFIGILLMVAFLVVGHIFNVLINSLGAFIHPARLQYVEFFTKFYEDGGTGFRPFGLKTKDLIIRK